MNQFGEKLEAGEVANFVATKRQIHRKTLLLELHVLVIIIAIWSQYWENI